MVNRGKNNLQLDIARRGLANIAGLIAFDHATVNSKSVVVRKRRKMLRNEHLPSFCLSKNVEKIYR